MKRLFSILSVVLITMSVAAQTIDYTNIQITEENVHTKVVKKKYTFASLNYGFNSPNDEGTGFGYHDEYSRLPDSKLSHAIGFSIGQVRQWGWYANIMFGTHMKIEKHGHVAQDQDAPYNSCFSIVPGVMCRCGIPLYAFVGIGYGYQAHNNMYRRGRDYEWEWGINERWSVDPFYIHTIAWQVGFMGIIKCVTVKAAFTGIGVGMGAELGIGYAFEHKN